MRSEGQSFTWFGLKNIKIEIPFFQRPYVWDEGEWNELIDSIQETEDDRMPFIGSFILQPIDDEQKNYMIIDGQQRLITLSLMIRAYLDLTKAKLDPYFVNNFESCIYETSHYKLEVKYSPRITASQIDKDDFNAIMNNGKELVHNPNSRISRCYNHFLNYFKSLEEDLLYSYVSKFLTDNNFFINIFLDKKDDEQRIFDTVNSLGKDLTNGEIIKNYLFQRLKNLSKSNDKDEEILALHQKYWIDIFYSEEKRDFWAKNSVSGRFTYNVLELFLKDFATIKRIYIASNTGGINGLDKSYKKYINNFSNYDELVNFLKEIYDYAICFYKYKNDYAKLDEYKISDILNTTLFVLDRTDTSTFNSYILKLVKEQPIDINEQLFALQRFILKRTLYNETTKNYNKVCQSMITSEHPIDTLNKYDEDDLILDTFPRGLLNCQNKIAVFLLFIIEMIRRNGKENKYLDSLKFSEKFSLEHIMPKKWNTFWKNVPCFVENTSNNEDDAYLQINNDEEIEKVRNSIIMSLGNMTILPQSLNNTIKNKSIGIKINGDGKNHGVKDFVGAFSITKEIVDKVSTSLSWDERDIIERTYKLFDELNAYYNFVNDNNIKKQSFLKENFNSDSLKVTPLNYQSAISNKGKNTRNTVLNYLKKENLIYENELFNYVSLNKDGLRFWVNPDINRLSHSWCLAINDTTECKLHILHIPENFKDKNLIKIRVLHGKECLDLEIIKNDMKEFIDIRSKINFSKRITKTINY